MKRGVLDVSSLPTVAFGSRDPLYWGVLLLIAIEGSAFAMAFGAYFYVRGGMEPWPPHGLRTPEMALAAVETALLLASAWPTHRVNLAAQRGDLRAMRAWLAVAAALAIAFLALRFVEFFRLPFRWDTDAHGSIFWTILGLHTLHGVTGVLEYLVLIALLSIGPVHEAHAVDVEVTGFYWYFVVVAWLPFFVVLYGERWF